MFHQRSCAGRRRPLSLPRALFHRPPKGPELVSAARLIRLFLFSRADKRLSGGGTNLHAEPSRAGNGFVFRADNVS